jgi:hypothetical protein
MKSVFSFCLFAILWASLFLNSTEKVPQNFTVDSSNHFFSSKTPAGHTDKILDFFIKEESIEEEDELNHSSSSFIPCKETYSLHELHFGALVNNDFLHLLSAILQKADPPYFILYHSWKSELV